MSTSGKCRGDLGALGRVVVGEDERVEPEPERSAISASCSGLRRQSATKAAKSSSRSRIRGFRSNGARAASASFLEATASSIPRRPRSRRYSWKAANASPSGPSPTATPRAPSPTTSPERVVEVDHEAARAETQVARENRGGLPGEERQRGVGEGLAHRVPEPRVEPPLLADPGRETVAVDEQHGRPAAAPSLAFSARTSEGPLPGSRSARWPNARLVRNDERVLDDAGAERRADGSQSRRHRASSRSSSSAPLSASEGSRGRTRSVRSGRASGRTRRARCSVEDLLLELAERRRVQLGVDPERPTGELEIRGELRAFVRAQNRKADVRFGGGAQPPFAAPDDAASQIPGSGLSARTSRGRSSPHASSCRAADKARTDVRMAAPSAFACPSCPLSHGKLAGVPTTALADRRLSDRRDLHYHRVMDGVRAISRVEAAVAQIWRDILGLERCGRRRLLLARRRLASRGRDARCGRRGPPDARRFPGLRRGTDGLRARRRGRAREDLPAPVPAAPRFVGTGALQLRAGAPLVPRPADGPDRRLQHALGARIRGALDVPALERALREVVRRHNALRTTSSPRRERPRSFGRASLGLRAARSARRARSRRQPPPAVDAVAEAVRPCGRPARARAAAAARGPDHVLELVFDHIICDGWSQIVVIRRAREPLRRVPGRREPGAASAGDASTRNTPGASARG